MPAPAHVQDWGRSRRGTLRFPVRSKPARLRVMGHHAATAARRDSGEHAPRGRRTLQSAILLAALTLMAWGGYALFARRLVLSILAHRKIEPLQDASQWQPHTALLRLPDPMFFKAIVFVWGAFLVGAGFPRLSPRAPWGKRAADLGLGLAVTALLWFGAESFVAPFLIHPLGLEKFYAVLDVDHRLPPHDPLLPTNADGIRSRRESTAYPAGDFNILFLGDSFTYGFHVGIDDAFPAQAEVVLRQEFPALRVNVANFGWVSSSPLLSLRLLRDIGARYHPRLVVMCFDMTDFFDDIHQRHMLEQKGIYWYYDKCPVTLRAVALMKRRAVQRLEELSDGIEPPGRFFMSAAPLETTRRFCGDTRRNLDGLDSCATALGAGFMVFVLPRSYQYSAREAPENWEKWDYTVLGPYALEPFRYFDELRGQVGYPVFSLLPIFQRTTVFPTCFIDDPHWNRAGHWIAGRAIARLVGAEIEARTGIRAGPEPAGGPPREPARRVKP